MAARGSGERWTEDGRDGREEEVEDGRDRVTAVMIASYDLRVSLRRRGQDDKSC
jgi:hypothetical protein